MNHTILTRMRFDDKNLMRKYLVLTKDVLVPSLKSQTNQNFTWILMIRKEDEEFLKSEIDYPFIVVLNDEDNMKYVIDNNINIQTRHDCDDFMYPNYIEKIQTEYIDNISKYNTFLIHSQPTQLIYQTGKINKLRQYQEDRTSMHLSLCQKEAKHHIHEYGHGQMWKIAQKVIMIGEGYTQWVIHGDNISKNPLKSIIKN
jgi:hypothetical protein